MASDTKKTNPHEPRKARYETPRVEESARFETLAAGCTKASGSGPTCGYGVPSIS